ncbi:MAG TPA: FAD:protein FMN transferase [Nakamurella sp.]
MPEPITSSTATPALRVHSFRAMACQVTVQLVGVGTDEAMAAVNHVQDLFSGVEAACTRFDPRSPLMVANAAPRRWHQVPESCFEAIREAHEAYRITDGLFDPRVLRCLQANGYDRSLPFSQGNVQVEGQAPDSVGPARRRWRPGFDDYRGRVRLGPLPIDLGGIGKGLAVRWALTALAGCGSSVMVEAGGDLASRGAGPEGTGWRAAVEDPLVPAGAPKRQPVAVLDVSDLAVATSSTRLRSWRVGGKTVHHLIDPRTARPAATGLASVTVIHADPGWAEVWSKSLFVVGARDIAAHAVAKGLAAVWVEDSGRVGVSPAARDHVLWQVDRAGA